MRNNLTKLFIGVTMLSLLAGTHVLAKGITETEMPEDHLYAMTTCVTGVTEIEPDIYEITSIDFNGNEWVFTTDAEDWHKGDACAMVMHDKGTPEIFDDVIIGEPKYDGWMLINWYSYRN